MYLHLGGGVVAPYGDILGVFDLDNASYSHLTREFLARGEKEGRVVNVAEDLPKSFVLCSGGRIYLSQLNSATLLKRAEAGGLE